MLNSTRTKRNGDKDGKALYKLMNNALYGETMENLRNIIDVKLVSKMSHKMFNNELVAICKAEVILTNLHRLGCLFWN